MGRLIQPWELAAAFGNAIVNAVLHWFYDGKKNAVVKVFTYAVLLFRFYTIVDNSMFKNFCRCNAAVSDLYDVKSKNKIVVIFFFLIPMAVIASSI